MSPVLPRALALHASEAFYYAAPDPDLAFEIARAFGRADVHDRAALWLDNAIARGFRDRERAASLPELSPQARQAAWDRP